MQSTWKLATMDSFVILTALIHSEKRFIFLSLQKFGILKLKRINLMNIIRHLNSSIWWNVFLGFFPSSCSFLSWKLKQFTNWTGKISLINLQEANIKSGQIRSSRIQKKFGAIKLNNSTFLRSKPLNWNSWCSEWFNSTSSKNAFQFPWQIGQQL